MSLVYIHEKGTDMPSCSDKSFLDPDVSSSDEEEEPIGIWDPSHPVKIWTDRLILTTFVAAIFCVIIVGVMAVGIFSNIMEGPVGEGTREFVWTHINRTMTADGRLPMLC